ncbi:MAG: DUF1858 domain-containing protein [Anaerorhabdus sp.]
MSENKVTLEMTIGEIISNFQGSADILMACGMHCLGCPSSQVETLKEACMVHGLDAEKVLDALNSSLKKDKGMEL